ncbi:hypothetical protein KA005_75300 [bacterium]|nr:hypothetical protein [bacterium]
MNENKAKKPRKYIKGSAVEPEFSRDRGDILNIDLYVPELEDFATEAGYAKITIYRRREIDDFGNTHYMFQNEFKPDKSKSKPKPAAPADEGPSEPKEEGGMPWED